MQYVVIVTTIRRDTQNDKRHESAFNIPAYNKGHAQALCRAMSKVDGETHHIDGPYELSKIYEVGATFYSSTVHGSKRVTLTMSDIEMIAQEYTAD